MSLFSKIVKSVTSPINSVLGGVGGILGGDGGGSSGTSSNQTANTTNVTPTTNISLDLKPLADVLLESQKQAAAASLAGNAVEAQKNQNFYNFIGSSKQSFVVIAMVGGLVYLMKKENK